MLCKNYEGMILLRFPALVLGFRVKGVGLTWGVPKRGYPEGS